ncbi:MAG: hypothetical protein VYB41_02655 [Bacteroidota bacterium]|nr:hypothetical protein [Bacteroidota bacterium]
MGDKKESSRGQKTDVEATAIINPKTGNLALSKGEIKKVSLQYTKETLMRKFPKESGGTFKINKEIFEKVLAKFKGSIKRNYDVIVRVDKMFQEKVYELCQIMIQKEEIPSEFRKATFTCFTKGKANVKIYPKTGSYIQNHGFQGWWKGWLWKVL